MTTRKEILAKLANKVRESRSEIRAGLEAVEKELREAVGELSLYAVGENVNLGYIDEDDWEYGCFAFDGQHLRILTSSTVDDMMNHGTPYEGHRTWNNIDELSDEKLTKLASPAAIDSIWKAVEQRLTQLLGEATSSAQLLSEFSNSQSEGVHDDLTKFIDGNYLEKQWAKARIAILTNPTDSISHSNTFVESVCRHYLDTRGLPLPSELVITKLIGLVVSDFPALKLPDGTDYSNDIKSLFGGVKSIAQGIGVLRTHASSAHGGDKVAYQAEARLANNLGGSIAIYILEKLKTHMKQTR
ncbi:abortive infection family protein [Pseudomonas plecoglossicida]|uniref:abortive infection family protein n=1 Tax=Pseudomonas plecoglossicida TaxID=70775 RepID=UPI0015E2AD32|nr:abortive infection family protein [Pseudomonas plecoglossicida]MBA1196908.1 abortive infection family protein [Pseudomonas plecoglossicida]